MSRRPFDVDFGPMRLPVGLMQDPHQAPALDDAAQAGAAGRFRMLLGGRPPHTEGGNGGVAPGADTMDAPRAACAGAQQLADEVQYLFGSLGGGAADAKRQVFVGLRRQVLPETDIQLVEEAGELQINFISINPDAQRWLAASLPQLARILGGRLARPLRLALSARADDAAPIAAVAWGTAP